MQDKVKDQEDKRNIGCLHLSDVTLEKTMEGRKLTLVPYKRWMEYHRWQEQRTPHLPPNPHLTEMSQLQHELQSLMDRPDLSETEKSQKYGQLLQRLKLFHQKAQDETAQPTLKDFKTLFHSSSVPTVAKKDPVPPLPPREEKEQEEEIQDVFQTPSAAPIQSKIAAPWLTPSPTPQREELKTWVKKMMSTPLATEPKKKDEGKPEMKREKKNKAIAFPPPSLPSTSTPVAHRTRKHVSKPPPLKSLSEEWVT